MTCICVWQQKGWEAKIAQLGERQTDGLWVLGSIPGLGSFLLPSTSLSPHTVAWDVEMMGGIL